jgi:anaerobic selenocysteine-containing dehydrogenase
MLTSLERAKRRGCKLVHINPLPEVGMTRFKHPQDVLGLLSRGTELADVFLQVRINGDVALLKGITKAVLAHEDSLDRDFIAQYTLGFEDFVSALQAVSWSDIVEQSGVEREKIEQAARILVDSERTII